MTADKPITARRVFTILFFFFGVTLFLELLIIGELERGVNFAHCFAALCVYLLVSLGAIDTHLNYIDPPKRQPRNEPDDEDPMHKYYRETGL